MRLLQNDFIDAALSYRLESSEWLPTLGLIGPQSPINRIIGMGLQGPVSSEELDRVEEFYRRHHSICEVVVSPYADMSVGRLLGERGYRITEWNTVLARPLDPADRFDTRRFGR
jgi:hypothetical protein